MTRKRFLFCCAVALGACGGTPAPQIRAVEVRILAHDTSWSASVSAPGEPREVQAGREVHLPLGAAVQVTLASRDFISLFSAPGLGLRDFAAPGLPATFHFAAGHAGSWELRGDELCGRPHTDKTRGRFIVEDPAAFRDWEKKAEER